MASAENEKKGLTRREFLKLGATAFTLKAFERPLAFINGENESKFKEWGDVALGPCGLKDVKFLQESEDLLYDRNEDAHRFKAANHFANFTENLVKGYGEGMGIVPTDEIKIVNYSLVASDGNRALLPLLVHERKSDGVTRLFAMFASDKQGRQVPPIPDKSWPNALQQLGQGLDNRGNTIIAPLVNGVNGLRLADENTLFVIKRTSGEVVFCPPSFTDLPPLSSGLTTEVRQRGGGSKVFAQIAQQPPTPMSDASPTAEPTQKPTEESKPTEKVVNPELGGEYTIAELGKWLDEGGREKIVEFAKEAVKEGKLIPQTSLPSPQQLRSLNYKNNQSASGVGVLGSDYYQTTRETNIDGIVFSQVLVINPNDAIYKTVKKMQDGVLDDIAKIKNFPAMELYARNEMGNASDPFLAVLAVSPFKIGDSVEYLPLLMFLEREWKTPLTIIDKDKEGSFVRKRFTQNVL